MMGWAVAWKCLVACRFGESSQQPTWPQLRQILKCSHTLPLFRHSSQPSALGVTSRMPAIWLQLFAMTASHLGCLEQMHFDAAAGEFRHVGRSGFSLGAGERRLDRRHVVEGQGRNQMQWGRPGRRCDRAFADDVLPQARNLLGDRNVIFEIVFVERRGILRRLVEHYQIGHRILPLIEPPQLRTGYSAGFALSPRNPCNAAATCAPSPIAPPTRLTDPERTSPTANTPGTEVSSADVARPSPFLHSSPVTTKPARSTMTPQPSSQPVAGSAPTNRKRLRMSAPSSPPPRRLRQRTRASEPSSLPSSATTSVLNSNSIFGVASMRSIR